MIVDTMPVTGGNITDLDDACFVGAVVVANESDFPANFEPF